MRKCVAVLTLLVAGACVPVTPDDGNTDWSVYLGDSGRQHYSPLDQITPENVDQLAVAWTYDSGEPRGTMYTSPLVVDGVLYGLSPQLDALALDAATVTPETIRLKEAEFDAEQRRVGNFVEFVAEGLGSRALADALTASGKRLFLLLLCCSSSKGATAKSRMTGLKLFCH